jgi:hypothetical protein
MDGGIIQNVLCNNQEVEIVLCDFDVEGEFEEDEDGNETEEFKLCHVAHVDIGFVDPSKKFYEQCFRKETNESEQQANRKLKELDF